MSDVSFNVLISYFEREGIIYDSKNSGFVSIIVQVAVIAFLTKVRHFAKHYIQIKKMVGCKKSSFSYVFVSSWLAPRSCSA